MGKWEEDVFMRMPSPSKGQANKKKELLAIRANGRARPTNNQLLYKAHLRWQHYMGHMPENVPTDLEACASVTSAFLKVLEVWQTVEMYQQPPRNILQILSTNTRRTKVVELSSGTHRIPDELKKHNLLDGFGGQYSTNLDRNRYGNDDQYLFTVIRYNLETLGLCPCMVDVEIIDAKAGNESLLVSAGKESCVCKSRREMDGRLNKQRSPFRAAAVQREVVQPATSQPRPTLSEPSHSTSQLFDALVMAATGAEDDDAGLDGQSLARSDLNDVQAQSNFRQQSPVYTSRVSTALPADNMSVRRSNSNNQLFGAPRDSVQKALDAYRQAEDGVLNSSSKQAGSSPESRRFVGGGGPGLSRFGRYNSNSNASPYQSLLNEDMAAAELNGLAAIAMSGVAVSKADNERLDGNSPREVNQRAEMQTAGSAHSAEADTDEHGGSGAMRLGSGQQEDAGDCSPFTNQDVPRQRRSVWQTASNDERVAGNDVKRLSFDVQQIRHMHDQLRKHSDTQFARSDDMHTKLTKMEVDIAMVRQDIDKITSFDTEVSRRIEQLTFEVTKSQQQAIVLMRFVQHIMMQQQQMLSSPAAGHMGLMQPAGQPNQHMPGYLQFPNATMDHQGAKGVAQGGMRNPGMPDFPSVFPPAAPVAPLMHGCAPPFPTSQLPMFQASRPLAPNVSRPADEAAPPAPLDASGSLRSCTISETKVEPLQDKPQLAQQPLALDNSGENETATPFADDESNPTANAAAQMRQDKDATEFEKRQNLKRDSDSLLRIATIASQQEPSLLRGFGSSGCDSLEILKGLPEMSQFGSISDLQSLFSLSSLPNDNSPRAGGLTNSAKLRKLPHANQSFSYASPYNPGLRGGMDDEGQGGPGAVGGVKAMAADEDESAPFQNHRNNSFTALFAAAADECSPRAQTSLKRSAAEAEFDSARGEHAAKRVMQ